MLLQIVFIICKLKSVSLFTDSSNCHWVIHCISFIRIIQVSIAEGGGFRKKILELFYYADITEDSCICINFSVHLNAYVCGINENGFGYNATGSDKMPVFIII